MDGNDYILSDQKKGKLFYDADGNGTSSGKELFAKLDGGTELTNKDFLIV